MAYNYSTQRWGDGRNTTTNKNISNHITINPEWIIIQNNHNFFFQLKREDNSKQADVNTKHVECFDISHSVPTLFRIHTYYLWIYLPTEGKFFCCTFDPGINSFIYS